MHRVLSVEGERLRALSRRGDRYVIAVAGGRSKIDAVRGALRGGFINVLVTDEDCASGLLASSAARRE
jgi:DNA-binding transcriptional regulator LsrR (DeoR family)